jgi:hypothetical protein
MIQFYTIQGRVVLPVTIWHRDLVFKPSTFSDIPHLGVERIGEILAMVEMTTP